MGSYLDVGGNGTKLFFMNFPLSSNRTVKYPPSVAFSISSGAPFGHSGMSVLRSLSGVASRLQCTIGTCVLLIWIKNTVQHCTKKNRLRERTAAACVGEPSRSNPRSKSRCSLFVDQLAS
jgi:hypothetical protein